MPDFKAAFFLVKMLVPFVPGAEEAWKGRNDTQDVRCLPVWDPRKRKESKRKGKREKRKKGEEASGRKGEGNPTGRQECPLPFPLPLPLGRVKGHSVDPLLIEHF